MNKIICDYCSEPWPKHQIVMSRKSNGDNVVAELCDQCLEDIAKAAGIK